MWNKYNVEQKIEDKIDVVKDAITDVAWSIAKDIGWSTVHQMGELMSMIMTPNITNDHDIHNDNDNTTCTTNNDDDDATVLTKDSDAKKKIKTKTMTMTRNPSHSVLGSLGLSSSHSSAESFSKMMQKEDADEGELETYRQDFVQMLQQGLYVFASYSTTSISTTITSANPEVNGDKEDSNAFRLRVLFYDHCDNDDESSSSLTEGREIKQEYFVLQPVEVNENSSLEDDDVDLIAREDIHGFRPVGTNGIQFLASTTRSTSTTTVSSSTSTTNNQEIENVEGESTEVMTVIDKEGEEETPSSVPLLTSASTSSTTMVSSTSNASLLSSKSDEDVVQMPVRVLTEIVLSNSQDRETLLHGLRTCFHNNNRENIMATSSSADGSMNDDSSTRYVNVNNDGEKENNDVNDTANESEMDTDTNEIESTPCSNDNEDGSDNPSYINKNDKEEEEKDNVNNGADESDMIEIETGSNDKDNGIGDNHLSLLNVDAEMSSPQDVPHENIEHASTGSEEKNDLDNDENASNANDNVEEDIVSNSIGEVDADVIQSDGECDSIKSSSPVPDLKVEEKDSDMNESITHESTSSTED